MKMRIKIILIRNRLLLSFVLYCNKFKSEIVRTLMDNTFITCYYYNTTTIKTFVKRQCLKTNHSHIFNN